MGLNGFLTNEAKYFEAIVDNGCPEGLEFSPTFDIISENLDSCSSRRRIFGGVSANPSSWPWIAKIEIHNPTGDLTQCSGTILDDHWILTAAGCCTGGTGGVYDPTFNPQICDEIFYNIFSFDCWLKFRSRAHFNVQ